MKRLWVILFVTNSLVYSQTELGSFPLKNKDVINLFEEPSNSSKIIYEIEEYPSFVVVLDSISNLKVSVLYQGVVGWVNLQDVSVNSSTLEYFLNKVNEKRRIESVPTKKPKIATQLKDNITPQKEKANQSISTQNTPVAKQVLSPIESTVENIAEKEVFSPKAILIIVALSLLLIGMTYLYLKTYTKYKKTKKKYDPIISVDEAIEKSISELEEIQKDYKVKKGIYSSLLKEVNELNDSVEMMDYGMYEPQFDFDTSEKYKKKIKSIRDEQKQIIRYKNAVIVHQEWTVNGSRAKGRTMENRAIRLTLRAFNGEADSIMAKVRWNNFESCKKRLNKSREMINKLNQSNSLSISAQFMNLKEKELHAIHEYNEKKQQEKEERRERLAEEREEKKVLLEAKKAREKAEKEQAAHEEALEIARKELGLLSGEELTEKNAQIEKLEEQLKEALEKKERAMSMAQLTKQGHVYVISNIGSFGEEIYKIGLTRRLEPMDRVKELGDASVPFKFDLHAMIFSEDAPVLEKKLHEVFHDTRVNMVNNRKEYFRVSLEEIEKETLKVMPDAEFYKTTESREYRETLALLQSKEEQIDTLKQHEDKFPDSI